MEMSLLRKFSLTLVSFLALSLPAGKAFAQSFGGIFQEISISEVPAPAITAATVAAGVSPTDAAIEIGADGKLIYGLSGQNSQGNRFEVDVNAIGEIQQVEEEIDQSQVPPEVLKGLRVWLPDFQPTVIRRSVRATDVIYEFNGKDVQGNNLQIEMPSKGGRLMLFTY
ncbi:hypothetical protein BJP37_23380 [Moorena bouillonii PNG]|uniref:Uncharacterized protein n=1 Tax=Moorena bouillonii PNG TaxID=568701 RepID=A0A1U7N6D7_9CYAN|nr:hypothetical protein BJP37_23380 [Moorena bouillonii PNG]